MKRLAWSLLSVLTATLMLTLSACGSSAKKTTCHNECSSAGATECAGSQVRTCVKDADGCFAWGTAADCPATQTCQGSACACTVPCGGSCCNAGSACIDGACCDTPCGSTCGCQEPQFCAVDAEGNKTCGSPCSTSISCSSAGAGLTCCVAQPAGAEYPGACLAPPSNAANHVCKCNFSGECDQGQSCAPDSPAGIGGPFVCAPLDGTPGGGCDGAHVCTSGNECWQTGDNAFCTNPCNADSDCSTGACCIKDPDAMCVMAGGCTKAGGCMPCP